MQIQILHIKDLRFYIAKLKPVFRAVDQASIPSSFAILKFMENNP